MRVREWELCDSISSSLFICIDLPIDSMSIESKHTHIDTHEKRFPERTILIKLPLKLMYIIYKVYHHHRFAYRNGIEINIMQRRFIAPLQFYFRHKIIITYSLSIRNALWSIHLCTDRHYSILYGCLYSVHL